MESGNTHALWLEGKSLAARIRVRGIAARQKQRWAGLRHPDDFGCIWFEETVYGVCNKITGGHPLAGSVAQNAPQWVHEGQKRTGLRDRALFQWFFAQVNLYFEGTQAAEIAADTLKISLPTGATLRDFLAHFTTQRATSLALNATDDPILVRGAVAVIRRQFPTLSLAVQPIITDPGNDTSQDILETLTPLLTGGHRATPADLTKYPLFPADFKCLDGTGGGRSARTQIGPCRGCERT